MKKIPLFSAIIMALFTFSACGDKAVDTPSAPANEKTGLQVSIDFDKSPKTAAESDAVPITSWSNNIKSLMLILTQGSGSSEIIKDARVVAIPTSASDNVKAFSNITAGTYNVYLVANSALVAAGSYGGAIVNKGLPGDAEWSASALKGVNMSSVKLAIKPISGVNYNTPSEIFMAKSSPVVVNADVMTPIALNLKRAVSLVRIRINKGAATNVNVDFMNANADVALARFHKEYSLVSEVNTSSVPNDTDYLYQKGGFSNQNPSSTLYSPTQIITADFGIWKELLIFPTTNDASALDADLKSERKIFVRLGAWVPEGYKFYGGPETGSAPAGGAMAYWGANVDRWFKANQIMEVNCTLLSNGKGNPGEVVPTLEGMMSITVNLQDWNTNIESTPVEM